MQELVIEAGRSERHYWQELWRYRALPSDRMARYFGALQADRDWPRLGADPTIPDDGGLHNYLRPGGQAALMVLAGMPPWSFLSALSDASNRLFKQRASDQQG